MSAVVYINYPRKEGSWFDVGIITPLHLTTKATPNQHQKNQPY